MYRPLVWICAAGLLFSCASEKKKLMQNQKSSVSCTSPGLDSRHIRLSTQAKSHKFNGCFVNYLKLHKLDYLNLNTCVDMRLDSTGTVSNVSISGDKLSNDLKWCLTQELWKMGYSKLQLLNATRVKFDLNFKVRK